MPRSIAYSSDPEDRALSEVEAVQPQVEDAQATEEQSLAAPVDASPAPTAVDSHPEAAPVPAPSLKVTLRTSINHLVNPSEAPSSPDPPRALPPHLRDNESDIPSSRSPSMSPSGREPAIQRVRQAASYSSDSDTEPNQPEPRQHDELRPPLASYPLQHDAHFISSDLPPVPPRPKSKQKRKPTIDEVQRRYEWMESNGGEPGPSSGWSRAQDVAGPAAGTDPLKPKKPPRKKKPDGVPGPGKAWRKGIKKGMPLPWATDDGPRPVAYESTRTHVPTLIIPREASLSPVPSGPAVASELGFPVLRTAPITKLVPVGPAPKVGAQFATADVLNRDRKEPCRTWQRAARTIFNVTGTRLKFHTWLGSPTSALADALQQEHAIKLAQAQAAQLEEQQFGIPSGPPPPEKGKGKGKASMLTATPNERPVMVSADSFDSSTSLPQPHFRGDLMPGDVGSPLRHENQGDIDELEAEGAPPKKKIKQARKSGPKIKLAPMKLEAEVAAPPVEPRPEVVTSEAMDMEVDVDDVIASAL